MCTWSRFQQKVPAALCREIPEHSRAHCIALASKQPEEDVMKYALIVATLATIATPVLADEVGVRVGPVGAGVTVGAAPDYRDRDRDRTTVIKEREPRESDRTTIIKKERDDGTESKTIIRHDND
jgi:hypothetical protein